MNLKSLLNKFYSYGGDELNTQSDFVGMTHFSALDPNDFQKKRVKSAITEKENSVVNLPKIKTPTKSKLNESIGESIQSEKLMSMLDERLNLIEKRIEERQERDQKMIMSMIREHKKTNVSNKINESYIEERNAPTPKSGNNIKSSKKKQKSFNNDFPHYYNVPIFYPNQLYPYYVGDIPEHQNNGVKKKLQKNLPHNNQNEVRTPNTHFQTPQEDKIKKKIKKSIEIQTHQINDNLEKFKSDITKQLKKLIPKKKSKFDLLLEEFNLIKNQFRTDESANIHLLIQKIDNLKIEINHKLSEETDKNREHINMLNIEMLKLKESIFEQIQSIEIKKSSEFIKNRSSEKLIKIEKPLNFLVNEPDLRERNIPVLEKENHKRLSSNNLKSNKSVNYQEQNINLNEIKQKPTKAEIIDMIESLKKKENDNEIKIKSKPSKMEIYYLLDKKRNNNIKIESNLKKPDDEIDFNEWKNRKSTNLKENLKNNFMKQKQQIIDKMKNFIDKQSNFKPQKINIFRSYVYSIIAMQKLIRIYKFNQSQIRYETLKIFVKCYESLDEEMNSWVFSSIIVPFKSVFNYENLNLDIMGNFDSGFNDRYIKLEIRLTAIIENLISTTNINQLNSHILKYLNFISNDYSYVPLKFFPKFVLSRIELENNMLINLEKNQKMLIIANYIIVCILIRNILLNQKFSGGNKNERVMKNFKIISSIFYQCFLEIFIELIPLKQKNLDLDKKEVQINENNENNKKIETSFKEKKQFNEKFIQSYNLLKEKKNENDDIKKEKSLLDQINNQILEFIPDRLDNEIEFFKGKLFAKYQLSLFFKTAEKNKFDLKSKIMTWCELIYNLVHK